jgi:hypothetical protein
MNTDPCALPLGQDRSSSGATYEVEKAVDFSSRIKTARKDRRWQLISER